MASSSFYCSVSHGFNFPKDSQLTVGHINVLEIGSSKFEKDMEVLNPTKIESSDDKITQSVVGVLSSIFWNGGYAEPVQFSCQISTKNKQDAVLLQHTKLSNTEVKVSFTIYEYDPVEKKFYKAMHTTKDDSDTPLKGLVEKSGGDLALMINTDNSTEVASPLNYTLSMGVMPQEKEQDIHFAASVSAKFVKKWGVTVNKKK